MSRISTFVLSWVVCACAQLHGALPLADQPICDIESPEFVRFPELAVHAYTDRHGDYLTIDACPDHTVDVNYSHSGLYTAAYQALLKQMRVSAYQGGYPVKMTISGSYTGSDGKDRRATVIVDKILDYDLTP